jgi:uncharacterized membrane protein YhhN
MTTMSWVFAGLALGVAVVEWWATFQQRTSIRYVTKPLALALLIGVAVTLDPFDPTIRTWLVVGLVLSLAGDVFLLGPESWFVGGLASFLLGHIAYVVALQQAPRSIPWTLVGVAVVLVAIATIGRRIIGGVKASGQSEMVGPVFAYLVVISAMVVSAFGTAAPWAIVGATLFYASDAILAWNRFVEARRFGGLAVMVTYHLGQAGLVAWLVTG